MRLRNFLIQMGFALFVAMILAVFAHNIPLAILYVVGHLIWAFFSDRKTVCGERAKASLEAKYPEIAKANTDYQVGGKTVSLKDQFVKSALLDTICFSDYSTKNNSLLEHFYSSTMAGNYQLHQYVISKKEFVPGNDSSDEYYIYCNEKKFEIFEGVYKKCKVGDSIVSVKINGLSIFSILIWLDSEDNMHKVAWQNKLYRFGLRTNTRTDN